MSDVTHILVLPDRDAAEELAERLAALAPAPSPTHLSAQPYDVVRD